MQTVSTQSTLTICGLGCSSLFLAGLETVCTGATLLPASALRSRAGAGAVWVLGDEL